MVHWIAFVSIFAWSTVSYAMEKPEFFGVYAVLTDGTHIQLTTPQTVRRVFFG